MREMVAARWPPGRTGQLDFSQVPTFCRHNRLTAECPICSKGTVLDPNLKPARPRRTSSSSARKGGAARSSASAAPARVSRGEFASAGPYDGREIRLEKVPGGLRLAGWQAGQLLREAPVLELRDLPALLAEASQKELLAPVGLVGVAEPVENAQGASPGRSGELRDG